MIYKITLTDRVTKYSTSFIQEYDDDEHVEFMFNDGNNSCDHNRSTLMIRYGKDVPQEIIDNEYNEEVFSCISDRIYAKIETLEGKIIYEEDE